MKLNIIMMMTGIVPKRRCGRRNVNDDMQFKKLKGKEEEGEEEEEE